MSVDLETDIQTGETVPPLVYAGRFAQRLGDRSDVAILDDGQATARELLPAIERAPLLVILDALSFPYELLREGDWDCPLLVCLPSRFTPDDLVAVLGEVLMDRLEFFDRVVTDDADLWAALQPRYGLAVSQWLQLDAGAMGEVVDEAVGLRAGDVRVEATFASAAVDPVAYWSQRGTALAQLAPHRAVGSLHHDLRANKAMHRVQARVLRQQLAAARAAQPRTRRMALLEVGAGVGRWASLAGRDTEFVGTDVSDGMVSAARRNYPECRFEQLDADLRLPFRQERFDLAFTATVLHHNPNEHKRRLVAHMWRVVRPGGRLLFLEDFVTSRRAVAPTVFPMTVGEFVELVLDATNGQVVLEHVEALRYRHDDLYRSGVVTMSKVGTPRTW